MPASTTPFTQSQVCKAAIAGMFGKSVGKTQVAKTLTRWPVFVDHFNLTVLY
ncbi:hypothetical protein GYM28_002965 [Escherichia coli]|nr:hypothetical protein [Escherichia coli]